MAKLADSETGEVLDSGVWLVGDFLGRKAPAPYEIEGRKGMSRPKIGLRIYGAEYVVQGVDLYEVDAALNGAEKGDRISVKVYPVTGRYGLRWALSPSAAGGWD